MKRKLLFLASCMLFVSSAFANQNPLEPKNFVTPDVSNKNQNQDIEDLKSNEFRLNLTPEDIKKTQDKDKEIREAFDKFSQKEINYKPVIRPISSMDTITLHPYFTFSILLPSGSVINHIDSSTPMAVLKYENNAVLIRPNRDFKISNTANIVILYKLNDTNQILNILATFYEKNEEMDKLNLVYSYVNHKKLDDLEVIQAYIKEHNSYPKNKYSYLQINDITYRIVEDNQYGTVFINNKKYRVDNNTIYR